MRGRNCAPWSPIGHVRRVRRVPGALLVVLHGVVETHRRVTLLGTTGTEELSRPSCWGVLKSRHARILLRRPPLPAMFVLVGGRCGFVASFSRTSTSPR